MLSDTVLCITHVPSTPNNQMSLSLLRNASKLVSQADISNNLQTNL